MMKGAESSV